MPRFFYKAKSGPNQIAEGTIEAETRTAAIGKLSQMGQFPLEISEEVPREEKQTRFSWGVHGRIHARDVGIFTRQLSNLLESGLTLIKALTILSEQTENRKLQRVIGDIAGFIRDGKTLSEALTRYPSVFSGLFISMVRSGEVGGTLEAVLTRLADFFEREEEIKSKIRTAMAYPLLMASVGLATIFILLTFVIPKLVSMFEEMGQILPLPTRILISISGFFAHYWWLLLAVAGFIFFLIRRRTVTPEGKFAIDSFKLALPILGPLIKKTEIARFGRTLGTLLANGVPILQSIGVVIDTMSNKVLRQEVELVRKEITEGATLTKGITKSAHFPIFVTNMIAVGEESGGLDKALLRVADSYDREVDSTTGVITSLLEPGMILIMGSIVGFIVISMLLPIFQISIAAR